MAERVTRTGRLLPWHCTDTVVAPTATSRTRTVCGSNLAESTPSTVGTVTRHQHDLFDLRNQTPP